ncbi:MAG: insulinase family protein [Nanoarchaeota archaeon]|nr:insulinase family protein [Nanoarchaeota archaeon]
MKFKKKVLANGLTVLHEKRDVPVTTVMLAVKYGAAYETAEEKGIAHFIEHLCFKGTDKRDVKQIADEVEKVGGDLNAFTHEEITAYHVKLPSEHLNIAMDVIFDIFFNANFPDAEVEKEGNVICEEIKMYRDNPRSHVLDKIKNNLYEKPFGEFIGGTKETVKSMTREQLFEKHRAVYIPKNSILCVVGNNNLDEILKLAEKVSVDRDGKISPVPEIKLQTVKDVEKRGDIHQANLALGFHFPIVGEKGRYAAEVFSTILGQGMSSKLFSEVREKRGLVYGVKSELDLGKNYGYMIIWAGTDPEKVSQVMDISLKEYAKMGKITEKELSEAKVQVIGNRRVESEGSNDTAVNLILEEAVGNAEDYYEYEKNINSVTLEDIKELAKISEYASFSLEP